MKEDLSLVWNMIIAKKDSILTPSNIKKVINGIKHLSYARAVSKIKYAFEPRQRKFFYQRIIRGWDDSETWSLDQPIAKFIAPRLRRFQEIRCGHPTSMEEEEWAADLQKMVEAFEWYASDDRWGPDEFKNIEKHQEGIELFAKHFPGLWW